MSAPLVAFGEPAMKASGLRNIIECLQSCPVVPAAESSALLKPLRYELRTAADKSGPFDLRPVWVPMGEVAAFIEHCFQTLGLERWTVYWTHQNRTILEVGLLSKVFSGFLWANKYDPRQVFESLTTMWPNIARDCGQLRFREVAPGHLLLEMVGVPKEIAGLPSFALGWEIAFQEVMRACAVKQEEKGHALRGVITLEGVGEQRLEYRVAFIPPPSKKVRAA